MTTKEKPITASCGIVNISSTKDKDVTPKKEYHKIPSGSIYFAANQYGDICTYTHISSDPKKLIDLIFKKKLDKELKDQVYWFTAILICGFSAIVLGGGEFVVLKM